MSLNTQTASTSVPLALSWRHDVFLSFRGETRKTFSNYLYEALASRTIKVFRDLQIDSGTTISKELMTAIEESRFAIVVISQDYANSTWCLDELEKIIVCMQERKTIIPIFYEVEPSDVRHQRNSFGEAFRNHEVKFIMHPDKVERWKSATKTVGYMKGWDSKRYQFESELIKDIVEYIYKNLVCRGCNNRIDNGLSCLGAVWDEKCFLCKRCNLPFNDSEIWECDGEPYHKACFEITCYVCKRSMRVNSDGQVEFMKHRFWGQIYCPCHEDDRTPKCCSCDRLISSDMTFHNLADERKLCPDCKESSIISTNDEGESIYFEVQKFYEQFNIEVQKIPLKLVSRNELNETMDGDYDGSNRHLPVLRGVCVLQERLVTNFMFWKPRQVCYEAKEILILYGLPRILTGSLVAQQMMKAWLRLKGYRSMSTEVENGICRFMILRWLEDSSRSDSSNWSEFEKKLHEFRKSNLEKGSEALQKAKKAERMHGLSTTLETIRKTGQFPSVKEIKLGTRISWLL